MKLEICDLILRDAHQSLLATRMRTDDMLPIAEKIDQVGYWAVEMWGGATFDSAMRFLGENPWDRIRRLKALMPNTPFLMLLRGQNVVGYKHYPDDVLERFIVHAHADGIDVFRIFDALNDVRNMRKAMEVVKREGAHVQASLCYTIGPPYDVDYFVRTASQLAGMGADSICIKDMAGLITPYIAYELVARLKADVGLPVHLHSHSTSGMATAALLKAIEAGVDIVDTAISALSGITSHPPTESIVAALAGAERDTGFDLNLLAEISAYFAEVRKKYARFESGMKTADVRVLQYQIPGGTPSCAGRTPRTGTRRCWRRFPACGPNWATRRWSPLPANWSARRRRSTLSWESDTRSSRRRFDNTCGATMAARRLPLTPRYSDSLSATRSPLTAAPPT